MINAVLFGPYVVLPTLDRSDSTSLGTGLTSEDINSLTETRESSVHTKIKPVLRQFAPLGL